MNTPHRIRSFVRRSGRITEGQSRAHELLWSRFGLTVEKGMPCYETVFGRTSCRFLEIGFGSGQSLLALAKACPESDFIGVETHKAGIGALFLGIQQNDLTNVRVYDADVVDVLAQCVPEASLDGVQVFFPDPWPKRKHHPRRLIQPEFIQHVIAKLKPRGVIHLATDWQDYAVHMMRVLSATDSLVNMAGDQQFAARSPNRPVVTKFERRALRDGRHIWDLCFALDKAPSLT